jgi:para-aminobenzoate synthetase component 1
MIHEIKTNLAPHEVYTKIHQEPFSILLESQLHNAQHGRYALIGCDPFLTFTSSGTAIEIDRRGVQERLIGNPFAVLQALMREHRMEYDAAIPWPLGGAAGYFGYDLKDHVENLPSRAQADIDFPDCRLGFYDAFIVFDHHQPRVMIAGRNNAAEETVRHYMHLLTDNPRPDNTDTDVCGMATGRIISNFTRAEYLTAIRRVQEYIAAGDIYQANLSQRFTARSTVPPFELYNRLRKSNPAPFAAYLNYQFDQVISASPERFLKITGSHMETRPIKGTRPRGATPDEDERLARELVASAKDRAELVMIIDLERNDLGRVCRYGSVQVPDLITLESYATVHHLVSTVVGELRPEMDHVDCLRACFPGGSITGAPKVRAMQIIEELEPTKRRIYTGAIGYLGFNQVTDLSIVIRTLLHQQGTYHFQAGGAIVADSEPEAEYEETLVKAKALVKALQM